MKLGIVIPVYNRPDYLRQCIDSLKASRIPEGTIISFVDDASKGDIRLIISEYEAAEHDSKKVNFYDYTSFENKGVCASLKSGITILIEQHCDTIINLDSDAIVRADWIEKILSLKEKFPDKIVTGFNCLTKNANGTERHPIIEEGEGWNLKKSVGGLNMCFNREQYESWILPALEKGMKRLVNWDSEACKNSGGAVCTVGSVVQHIGIKSSMGHHEAPDVADDFVMETLSEAGIPVTENKADDITANSPQLESNDNILHLPSVTLVTVNCDKIEQGIEALAKSIKGIKFGAVKFLTSADTGLIEAVKIPHISTIQEYSRFMVKELYKYIDTDYVLVVQSDGYVKNPAAWNPEWLQYDYIGATWWYGDKQNVGNGGFSLRSKKLLQVLAADQYIVKTHPEDHMICRIYGRYLTQKHGIKFAPDSVAKKFSIEGFRQKDKTYSGQFGFHGHGVIFPAQTEKPANTGNPTFLPTNTGKADIVVINQPFGLGDFLFCIPIARDYIKEGYKVIWPVVPQYQNIGKHFPDITFINKDNLKIDIERKDEYELNGMRVIPLRWSYELIKVPFRDCMKSKYMMFGKDWKRWRESTWVRDTEKEDELFYKVLGLHDGAEYNLVNNMFRSDASGKALVNVVNGYKNIPLRNIEGFTLLDWGKVLENAMNIYTVSTSINYIIELLDLKAKEIHLYCRKPDERNFNNIDYIFTKEYKLHY